MSDTCPTVLIKSASKIGCAAINESDFDPAIHVLFEDIAPIAGTDPVIAPAEPVEAGDGIPVAIPADWETLHHKKIVALAKDIAGDFVPHDGLSLTDVARNIIASAVHVRANPPIETKE